MGIKKRENMMITHVIGIAGIIGFIPSGKRLSLANLDDCIPFNGIERNHKSARFILKTSYDNYCTSF